MGQTPHNDWDTPANGDFASYVERLNAAQMQRSPPALSPVAAPAQPAPAVPVPAAQGDGPTWAAKLRTVRRVVFLVFTAQALALMFLHKGSLPLLFFTGVVWFFLGRTQPPTLSPK